MARGRKSTKVKALTYRDVKLIKQLARTGMANVQQAKEYCNLNKDRLLKLEKSGYIKNSNHIVRGQNTMIIQLDSIGKEYCRQEEGIRTYCKAQTNHLEHDLKLTEMYYNLTPEIQNTWKHELQLIQEIYERFPEQKGNLLNCVDATVQINGEVIAIESIGLSYTKEDIEIKENIAKELLGCSRMESV